VRPLLTEIPTQTGNRLAAYRDLNGAADALDALIGPAQPSADDGRALDRRALFTKWFPKRIE
jgi:hypothetical protein